MNLNDRELLARTLQAEAGNQGLGGMLAVGNVIANRMTGGGNLRDVILAPAQFSAWNSYTGAAGGKQGQDMQAIKPSDDAYAAADAILSGNAPDVTGGATHYYNPSISQPDWGRESAGGQWTTIGNHIFGKAGGYPTGSKEVQDMSAQKPQGLMGMLGRLRTKDEQTGLSPFQNFAQALDPLIMPEMRGGEAIRASGQRRLDKAQRNRTKEWLKSQEGGELYAQAIEMGVPIGDVYSAFLKSQSGDAVVVGNTLVDRKTGKPIFTAPATQQSSGTITLADGTKISLGKQTETQAGSMDFGARMTFANSILENTEQLGTSLGEQFFSKIPVFGGALTSPEFKQYDQARQTFVNSILRRESGAAIAESEFESANRQYFPQPFDPPEVIEQKRAARELATTMMLAASGPNATQYAKDQAAQFAKRLNPLFGTEEYNKQREEMKKNTSGTTTAGGNERVTFKER